jgi:hypothetical protein
MDQNRKSKMEQAEGSRENVRNSGSSGDRGTSSDRAMFNDGSPRTSPGSSERSSGRSSSSERGSGSSSSSERGSGSSERVRGSSNSGGITNRELSREQCEQEQLPERGRSESEP